MRLLTSTALLFLTCLAAVPTTMAQDRVKVSGLAYLDYYYMVNSPNAEEEGNNGFTYRRLYLTTDFKISDKFKSRARLETKGSSTTPFVKDLYLQWQDTFGEGHHVTFGIASPPSFTVAEKTWGFRSLDKTIQDRVNVVNSRDFGVRLNGPITNSGSVKYAFMVANNNGVKEENDKYKRLYSQLEFYPAEGVSMTTGADYATGEDENIANLNAFAGITRKSVSAGIEGFYQITDTDTLSTKTVLYGVSVFGQIKLDEQWSFVARVDHTDRELESSNLSAFYALGALVFSPEENIRIMPNVIFGKLEADDVSSVTARLTIEAKL